VPYNPTKIAVNSATNKVYVINGGVVTVIDGTTNSVTSTITSSDTNGQIVVNGIAVNPNTNRIYATSYAGMTWVIDGNSDRILSGAAGVIQIRSTYRAPDIAINPVTNILYFAAQAAKYNLNTNNISYPSFYAPNVGKVAVNQATNMIYLANRGLGPGENFLTIFNGTNNQVVSSIPVGVNPLGVAVNPTRNLVYVANSGGSTITVINGTNDQVISTLTVGNRPYDIAVNPVTSLVYVSNLNDNTVSVGFNKVVPSSQTNTATLSVNAVLDNGPRAPQSPFEGTTIQVRQGLTLVNSVLTPTTISLTPVQNYTVYANDSPLTVYLLFSANGLMELHQEDTQSHYLPDRLKLLRQSALLVFCQ
jgi:YVTN family beta-propeller protein